MPKPKTTFVECDPSVYRLLDRLIAEFRPDLDAARAAGARLFLKFGTTGDELRPPLKRRGKRLGGYCRVHSVEDKADGSADVTITLDGDRWGKWPAKRQAALLHHELNHVAPWDKKLDALGRPALKSRPGDWEFDGFHDVMDLYGADSFEHTNLDAVRTHHRQADLFARRPGEPDDDPGPDAETEAA
jgi:hypothetical protein